MANNLANVSSDGFKAQRVFARLLDGVRPAAETRPEMLMGNLRQTGSAMDGGGFFVVQTPKGERYTHGGSLRFDEKHQIVHTDGRPLLGMKGPLKLGGGPVDIDRTGE